jgi:putative Mg2+ transporter-C (MgtC) family protein
MAAMSATLDWPEVAWRLVLTLLAGALLGYNRSEHGKAAGLRTTMLVCLAASVAMIQVNLLLPMAGRHPDSFVMNDLMRLPLGILSGMGFIGAGAILRRGSLVQGVTTAATLWLTTVIGLCLGGGQIALGMAATLLGFVALWGLQWVEAQLRRERPARLCIEFAAGALREDAIRGMLQEAGRRVVASRISFSEGGRHHKLVLDLREDRYPNDTATPAFCEALAKEPGVVKLQWRAPTGA